MATEVAAPLPTTDSEPTDLSPAAAIAEIYARYQEQVGRWALQLLGRPDHMEDIVQEVFVIVLRERAKVASLQRLDDGGGDPLERWLYRTTANAVRTLRWRERWRRWWSASGETDRTLAALPSDAPGALEVLEQKRVRDDIYAVLAKLGDRQRRMLILFEIEGLTGEEIAALTGAKLTTVWVTLHRARVAFLRELARMDPHATASPRRGDS